MFLKEFSERN